MSQHFSFRTRRVNEIPILSQFYSIWITTSCRWWCNGASDYKPRYSWHNSELINYTKHNPPNHFCWSGDDFSSRGCVVDFRHTPPPGSVQDETKWWNNGIIRWLDWWHNKRLYKLITDCDVIAKLWLHLLSASRKSLRSPHNENIRHVGGKEKTYFPLHSVIKFTFIVRLEERSARTANKRDLMFLLRLGKSAV